MKLVYSFIFMMFALSVRAEVFCFTVTIDGKDIEHCVDFGNIPPEDIIAGGGDCGGSSECGYNWLVIDGRLIKVHRPSVMSGVSNPLVIEQRQVAHVASSMEAIRALLQTQKQGELTLKSDELLSGVESFLGHSMKEEETKQVIKALNFEPDFVQGSKVKQVSVDLKTLSHADIKLLSVKSVRNQP